MLAPTPIGSPSAVHRYAKPLELSVPETMAVRVISSPATADFGASMETDKRGSVSPVIRMSATASAVSPAESVTVSNAENLPVSE